MYVVQNTDAHYFNLFFNFLHFTVDRDPRYDFYLLLDKNARSLLRGATLAP